MSGIIALLLLSGGGIFLFSREAQGSIPTINIDKIFNPKDKKIEQQASIEDNQFLKDQDILARTMWGEARGQGNAGMQAVASVVLNRLKTGRYGSTVSQVCQKPYQFSVWNKNDPNRTLILAVNEENTEFRRAVSIASRAMRGTLPDNTGGADHYLNIPVTKRLRGGTLPNWVDLKRKTAKIGAHTFLKLT